jgi:hypothetical protein
MESLLGFKPDGWDYLALASIFALVVAGLTIAVFVLGLPGRIAIARQRHAEGHVVEPGAPTASICTLPWEEGSTPHRQSHQPDESRRAFHAR